MNHKVVKIYEDSLDSISDSLDSISDSLDSISSPSPSVKIQISGGKVCLRQNITFENINFVDKANFPAHNLNFHWRSRWWDQIQATF